MKQFWGAVLAFGAFFGNLGAQAQNAYPPSNIIKAGTQVSLELRQTWTAAISGKDSDGDWTGDARGANGTAGKLFSFSTSSSGFVFQVAYSGATEYCLLQNSSNVVNSSGGNATYQGIRAYKQGTADPASDNANCRVTVSNQAAQPAPAPQPVPQPVPLPNPSGAQAQLPALTFPPRLDVGQRWEFRLGNRAIVYRAAFTGVENRGGTNVYLGTLLTDGSGDPFASRKLEAFQSGDTFAAYATDPQGGITVCSFTGSSSLQNNVLTGAVFFKNASDVQFRTLSDPGSAPCRANLEPVQGAVVQPVPQPVPKNLVATFPPKIGQSWTVTIDGLAPWVINFRALDQDGDPTGTALQNGVSRAALAFTSDGLKIFGLAGDNNAQYLCVFAANAQANGATLAGGTALLLPQGANSPQNLNKSCTATLNSQSLSSLTKNSETVRSSLVPSFLKLSPLF